MPKTNTKKYVVNEFECRHFARLVNNNAESQGIRCGYVTLDFDSLADHAIIAFNTTDKGIVYFEPQTDEEVENLEVGNDYWTDCVVSNMNYQDEPGDTIVSDPIIYW